MRIAIIIICLLSLFRLNAQDELAIAEQMYDDGLYEAVIEYLHAFEIRHEEDLLLEADTYHKLSEYEQAVEAYTQVLHREEENLEAYMRRGAVQLELGNFQFALKDVKHALRISPEHPEANFHMGNICYDQDDMKNAIKYYITAVNQRPRYPQAIYMIGAALSNQGQNKDAEKAFEQVLDELPSAKYNLAVVKLESERYQEAIELFNDLEKSGSNQSADMYFFRAESHFYLGDKHAACVDYKMAANLEDEEASRIFDDYCLKGKKKSQRKKREITHIDL